ncbi:hypothetical protein AVEN_103236-1 [Araneus ventricosus]|uniref:Uncharacterized protein n=1 Tax=Araneus ventricosus TaxID=182803 RepID=A0A4Y2U431_ARAVE|nr:hypothetical protein AVEN_103236-1 [Araneus ventricosus]
MGQRFKDNRMNAHDDERSRRPSVVTEDLGQKVDGKVLENIRFTISSLSNEFPQVSRRVLYGIVTENLDYRNTQLKLGRSQISMEV